MKTGRIFFILILLLFAAGCSKEADIGNPLDRSSPRVVATHPDSGSFDVSKFSSVRVIFSEEVDASSLSASVFSFTPPLAFSLCVKGNEAELLPAGPLPDGQKYFVTVNPSVKDLAGNAMEGNHYFSFRVAGINYSRSAVTFRADDSAGRDYFRLFLTGSFDRFGDYDPSWNGGARYALYDDGLHDDGEAGDGVWGLAVYLTADNAHSYSFGIDDDEDGGNGYLKGSSFFVTSTAPVIQTVSLYPPLAVTFRYYDKEGKVSSGIFLKGQFNNWANTDPMAGPSGEDRMFTVTKMLREGTYTYKYYADNDWDKVNPGDRTITVVYPSTTLREDYDMGGYNVNFRYFDKENKVTGSIYLKGDFNGWGDAHLMSGPEGPDRMFSTAVNAVAGTSYSYKYYADNDWDKLNADNRTVVIRPGQSEQNDYYTGPLDITFNYYDFEGKIVTSVLITGDFNGWSTTNPLYQMTQDALTNYKFSITLPLSQGAYSYKYYADNSWNKLNTGNRSLTVSPTNSRVIRDLYEP